MTRLSAGKLLKLIALGIGALVLLAVFVLAIVAWQVDRQWRQRLATIRAAGDPVSIADLAPEPIPDDENAAAYLQQIAPQLRAFDKQYAAFDDSPVGKAYDETLASGESPTADEIAAIRHILDKYPEIDAALAEAAACDEYASLLDFSLDHTQFSDALIKQPYAIRSAARFLHWWMQVLVADGKPNEAVERGIELLRLARLHDAEPTMVNYLVGTAVRNITAESLYDALSAGPVSPGLHAALDEELARHDDPQRMVRVLKTERPISISSLASMPQGANRLQRMAFGLFGWHMKRYWIGALDYFDLQIGLADRPPNEVHRQMGHASPDLLTGFGPMADLVVPALQAASDAHARNLVMLRALRIFNALTQYRDENGHEATGLADLALPEEATIDPFSGQPLRLKHADDGWIIYSVMKDGVDDGGDFKDMKDYGLAPPSHRATE
jgi:hypothetical protein